MKQEMIEKISIAVMNLLNDYSEDLRKYAEKCKKEKIKLKNIIVFLV